jgi:hypothetical protein
MTQTPTEPSSNRSAPGPQISPAELYKFIMEGIPYRYDDDKGDPRFTTRADPVPKGEHPPTQTGPGGMLYDVSGPARNHGGDKERLTKHQEQEILEKKGPEGLWWHFGDRYYRVTKALRIPYLVYQDDNPEPVIKHIFVGYAGIDGGGA